MSFRIAKEALNDLGREDRIPVPVLDPGEKYRFDSEYIIVLKDKAQAATNAIESVFDAEIHVGMCATHAAIRWMSTHAGKFRDHTNKSRCINDINWAFKIVGHVNLIPELRRMMMLKWVQTYGEPLVARDWMGVWGEDQLTRVENCQVHLCPLRGAIPCDNNALEAGNNADKSSLIHKKSSLFGFVDNVSTKIVLPTSMKDTLFEGRLKPRSRTKMNTAVYNIKYFVHIAQMECLDQKGMPTYHYLQFEYTDERNDVPKGSFLVAGAHCLTEMKSVEPAINANVFQDKEEARKWLGGRNSYSWVNIYKGLIKNPESMTTDPFMTFDILSGWNKCFHIVRPIIPDNGGSTEIAIRYYVEWMTEINHFPMISADDVISRKRKGLVSCTCHQYLHYCFCKHTYSVLRQRKIILGFPPTMFPVPVNKRKRGGRPRHIHGGEALNRDG